MLPRTHHDTERHGHAEGQTLRNERNGDGDAVDDQGRRRDEAWVVTAEPCSPGNDDDDNDSGGESSDCVGALRWSQVLKLSIH